MATRSCLLMTAVSAFLVAQTSALSSPAPAPELPIKVVSGFAVVVRGDIGPAHNLNILIDTGAVPSVLSEHLARQLSTKREWPDLVANASGSEVPYVTVHGIHLGPLKSDLPMVVVDLRQLGILLHTRIDAILGLDFFASQSFTLDYKRRKLVFGLSKQARHTLKSEIHREFGAPYWIVPLTLNGHLVRLLVDTGADSITLFTGQQRNVLQDSFRGPSAATLTGQQVLAAGQAWTLAFGGAHFSHLSVYMKPKPEGGLSRLDGLCGPTALGLTIIAFDWQQQTLRWDTD